LENYSGLQVSLASCWKNGARELPSGGGIGELLWPSGQYNFMVEKWSEITHLAVELENYSGLQVCVNGARENPSSGGIGELLRPSGQYNFMAESWSERTPI
jgi:hypothetical protein